MPPKPQVFKTPDGKEFSSRAEWRDYMMLTFYSFKNKNDEPEPLMKLPGTIEGQMFDIADCSNSTLLVLDHTEQVQIDQLTNCRVFIAACASSIFIRNCSNCKFYTCCRQLRLRDVTDCDFYIYSMAEVHIEFTSRVRFAPFNGGYPDHAAHLLKANLNINHNLWYDVYDHNDPGKTRTNWGLIPENEYEAPWYPLGPCDPAIPRTKPGSVELPKEDSSMQAFSLQQMIQDSKKIESVTSVPAQHLTESSVTPKLEQASDLALLLTKFFSFQAGQSLKDILTVDGHIILANGALVSVNDYETSAPVIVSRVFQSMAFEKISASNDVATVIAQVVEAGRTSYISASAVKVENSWKLQTVHLS